MEDALEAHRITEPGTVTVASAELARLYCVAAAPTSWIGVSSWSAGSSVKRIDPRLDTLERVVC